MAQDYEDVDISLEDAPSGDEEPFVYDEGEANLVPVFEGHPDGLDALREISEYVREKADEAEKSSERYRNRLAEDNKLLAGDIPDKSFPFEECAKLNIPLMQENLNRLHARLYSEIFGDWTNVVGVVPVGPEDDKIASLMSMHDNWQMRNDIPDFPRQMDRGLMMYLNHGDITCHSYRDQVRDQNRHEILTPDNFYVPYSLVSTMPDYSDCPYYVKVLTYARHNLQRMHGELSHVDDVLKRLPAYEDDPEQPIAEESNESAGIIMPDEPSYHAPYKLFQFEGWCHKLPGQTEDRFIQAIVDPFTQHVLKLKVHEEVSWKARARQRDMQQELDQYNTAKTAVQEARAQRDDALSEASSGIIGAPDMATAVALGQQAIAPIPDPEAPAWMDDPDNPPERAPSVAKEPIRMFAHAVNMEPMSGCLGNGYGRIQADFQRAANTMANQHVDSATAANAPPILTSIDMPDDLQYKPGRIHKIEAPVDELGKNILVLPSPPPNPALMSGVEYIGQISSQSVQAPDVLSGEPGKSGETFRGISSRIEQATKQLTVTGRKFSMFLRQIYLNNAKLNSVYLEEVAMRRLFDPATNGHIGIDVARSWYERDYNIEIRADLKFTPEAQKKTEAMERLQLLQQSPFTMQNARLQYEATRDIFIAMGKEEWVAHLGAPPPPPQTFEAPPPPPEEGVPPTGE